MRGSTLRFLISPQSGKRRRRPRRRRSPTTLTEKQFAAITITILNGTTSPTLPTDVASLLTTQNWPQPTLADAADNTVEESIVVYRYPADELMANSIAASLGIETVQQSDVYRGARVYVLLGADFVQ